MGGFGGGSPWPPYMSGPMGFAAEQRQLADIGMILRSPLMPFGKPTKTVCAYCGGPDYKERTCPGCGAREKEQRCSD